MNSRRIGAVIGSVALFVSACADDEGSVALFCEQIASMNTLDQQLAEIEVSNGDAVAEALTSFRTQLEQLAEVSPSEIGDDADTVARYGIALADAALSANPDDPFDRAAVLAAAAASEPGIEAANERLATFASRTCTAAP